MANDETISHFSHPGHDLVKRHYTGPFRCDMCWEDLSGLAYGCRAGCDFAIHDTCAGHPQTLLSPEHHPHELVLVQTRRDAALACDVCVDACAAGCFLYRCPPCGFDMHPRCVRLPQVVRSARHNLGQHDLKLVAVADEGRCCAACHRRAATGARAWYYCCTVCDNMDLHVSCAAGGGGGEENATAGAAGDGVPCDPNGELLLAQLKAQRDLNYARAIANIQVQGSRNAADLVGDYSYSYRTRWI
ncbi:unnamed protein product [Urochloa humidicola]